MEQAALAERLRLAGASGTDGHAAQLAAAAAEADAQQARQQLAALQQQLADAESAAEQAWSAAQAAQATARKLEADLEDLSSAYSTLDAHAGALQQQIDELQVELRRHPAAEPGAAAGHDGSVSEAEVERRVTVAREEAQQEADDAMTDLLVCLGQEEAKVGLAAPRLRRRSPLQESQPVTCGWCLAAGGAAAGAAGGAWRRLRCAAGQHRGSGGGR